MKRRVGVRDRYQGDTPERLRRFVADEWGGVMPEAGFRFWDAREDWAAENGREPDMDDSAWLSLPDGPFRPERL